MPRARIHKKEETKRLNNLPDNFVRNFYRDWLDGIDFSSNTDFQHKNIKNAPSEDVKKFLFVTSEFGPEIHGKTDLHVTNNRPNKASFRRKLERILKNIKNQNPIGGGGGGFDTPSSLHISRRTYLISI